VAHHYRVVIDVDHRRIRRYPLHDLVHIVVRRKAGADVEELGDALRGHQVAHGTAHEFPVLSYPLARVRNQAQ